MEKIIDRMSLAEEVESSVTVERINDGTGKTLPGRRGK